MDNVENIWTLEEGSAGAWRRLHNELRNLYTSQNIIRMIKSKRTRWAGHVVRVCE